MTGPSSTDLGSRELSLTLFATDSQEETIRTPQVTGSYNSLRLALKLSLAIFKR